LGRVPTSYEENLPDSTVNLHKLLSNRCGFAKKISDRIQQHAHTCPVCNASKEDRNHIFTCPDPAAKKESGKKLQRATEEDGRFGHSTNNNKNNNPRPQTCS